MTTGLRIALIASLFSQLVPLPAPIPRSVLGIFLLPRGKRKGRTTVKAHDNQSQHLRSSLVTLLAVLCVAAACTSPDSLLYATAETLAEDHQVQAELQSDFEGHWEGSIEIPTMSLGVLVDLHSQDGFWTGTIDIPVQSATGIGLAGIQIDSTQIQFMIDGVPGEPTFAGTLEHGEIAGTFTQHGQDFPFHLGRETIEAPQRPQEPEPPYPYREEEVSF
jgi:hypothetical protein